jgi:hypothetical protein
MVYLSITKIYLSITKMIKDRMLKNEIKSVVNNSKENLVKKKKWTSFTYIGKEIMPIAIFILFI